MVVTTRSMPELCHLFVCQVNNIRTVPLLQNARDALLTFAEVTTGMEDVVAATRLQFEQLSDAQLGDYVDLIRMQILAKFPSATLDPIGYLQLSSFTATLAQTLANETFNAVFEDRK